MVCGERRHVHQQDIGNNDDEPELRRTHFAVRQFELAFEMGVDADIDRERQISSVTERRYPMFINGERPAPININASVTVSMLWSR